LHHCRYWLSNSAEKFWDSGTSACTDASGMLCAARLNLAASAGLKPLVINIHKTPGSSRVGSGANPCAFVPQVGLCDHPHHATLTQGPVPVRARQCRGLSGVCARVVGHRAQHFFAAVDGTKEDFDRMELDWRAVSSQYFGSIQRNGVVEPGIFTNERGSYDLGVRGY
jgi:hypothetical protein